MMRPSEKMKLVDMQGSEVSVAHQCRLLNLGSRDNSGEQITKA